MLSPSLGHQESSHQVPPEFFLVQLLDLYRVIHPSCGPCCRHVFLRISSPTLCSLDPDRTGAGLGERWLRHTEESEECWTDTSSKKLRSRAVRLEAPSLCK